jgi:hypothetical protein
MQAGVCTPTVDRGDEDRVQELRYTVEDGRDAREREPERVDIDDVVSHDREDEDDHEELGEPDIRVLLQGGAHKPADLLRVVKVVPRRDSGVVHRRVHDGRAECHDKDEWLRRDVGSHDKEERREHPR